MTLLLTIGLPFLMSMAVALIGMRIAQRIFPKTHHWFAICLMTMPFYFVSLTADVEGWLVYLLQVGQWVLGGMMFFAALAGCWDNYAHAANEKRTDND